MKFTDFHNLKLAEASKTRNATRDYLRNNPVSPDQMAKPVKQMSVPELATVSDEALDNVYHYGRSTPGNTFGWQANLKSAAYAKHMIDKGVTDIEAISDAVHKGWWSVAQKFVDNPDQFSDTETLRAKGKFDTKMANRIAQMVPFNQLTKDQQDIDTVVAEALLKAITGGGEQGVAEDSLNEFDPGEHGMPPFTVYVGDTLIDKFASYDEAQEEVEYQRGSDPRWAHDQWKIVNGIGETVWEYDIGRQADDMRRQHKIQFIPRDNKDVAEGDYPDGSSIKTPGNEDWKQQYQQAVMAVKNARTQQEYEAASDRAGRIKDLLASKGIQVGAVLGQQGVAEGMKQTLRRFDPTIKARILSKSQDQTNQGLDTIQHLADLGLTSPWMVSRAMKPNTYFKNAERYAKLANKGVTEDHGPEHPEAPVNYGEYDREGDMAKDDLRTIDDAAEELYSILQADENLPEWVQSKITKAVDYIDTARDYMKAQKYEPGVAEGMFTKGPAIDPTVGKQINSIINRLHYHAKQTKDEYLRGTVQELFAILRNTGGTYSPPGSRDVAEGGAKYKVKSIGHDAKGDYYISPSTGKKVYKKAKVGDHENPKTGEHKGVTEATESRIDDGWFKQGAFKTSKKAAPVKYQLAQQSGTVNTLEGPVRYEAGHYIMTGPKGEQYPISPEKFNTLYDDNGDGTSTPKKISKLAKLADHDGVLHTSWGDLQYTKGNDYIVRHGAGDYGAVKKDIFAQTYDNQARKLGIDEEKFNITFKAKTPAGKSFEKKYDIDAADKYAAFDKIKKRLGAQYDALNYPTFLQGKKKAKMPPSVKTAMKNLNKGKVS